MRTTSPLHAVTWLVWAVAAAACVQVAPNPLYVAVVLAISFLVVSAHRLDTQLARAFPILVGLGVAFAAIRVVLTALTTHTAAIDGPPEHLWFTLPSVTLPSLLGGFTVGGPIEGTVVLQSAAQGANGQMQAIGFANQLAANQANQLLQIRGLLIAQQNAATARMQAQADLEAQQQAAGATSRESRIERTASPRNWLELTR